MNRRSIHALCGLLVILSGCASTPAEKHPPVGPEDRERLAERVHALYDAEREENWPGFYSLTAIARTGLTSLDEFQQSMSGRDFRLVEWRILDVKPEELYDELRQKANATASVRVRMKVTVARPDGAREKEPNQTDQWVLIDGDWYWGWRGWSSD